MEERLDNCDENDIQKLCICCLQKKSYLFKTDDVARLGIGIKTLIKSCFSVKLIRGEGLPENICNICIERAVAAYRFKRLLTRSKKYLQDYMHKKTTEPSDGLNSAISRLISEASQKCEEDLPEVGKPEEDQPNAFNNEKKTDLNTPLGKAVLNASTLDLPQGQEMVKYVRKDQKLWKVVVRRKKEKSPPLVKVNPPEIIGEKTSADDWEKMIRQYKCDQCPKRFHDQAKLDLHVLSHSEKSVHHQCSQCEQKFDGDEDLIGHFLAHSKPKPSFKCKDCHKTYTTKYKRNMHQKSHEGKFAYHCEFCNKGFLWMESFKSHLASHDYKPEPQQYQCTMCEATFDSSNKMINHAKKHRQVHPCSICDRAFAELSELQEHLGEHKEHAGPSLLCDYCGMEYLTEASLKEHRLRHQGENLFGCDSCDTSFASEAELKKHQLRHDDVLPFLCNTCFKKFKSSSQLTNHLRVHDASINYQCGYCSMGYPKESLLDEHLLKHESNANLKPHKCGLCPEVFAIGSELVEHMKIHIGEQPHSCDDCGRRFALAAHLKVHQKSHIKPFNTRPDLQQAPLKAHTRLCMEEKPVMCHLCSMPFAGLGKLNAHIAALHECSKQFACDKCGKKFNKAAMLQKHAVTHDKKIQGKIMIVNSIQQ